MKPCTHHWLSSSVSDYDLCHICGTFRSTVPADPSSLYRSDYWSHTRGHSTLQEQVHNVDIHTENSLSKNGYVLDRLDTENRGAVLEIGCAPGVLLGQLRHAGFGRVVGVEIDGEYEPDIREISGVGDDLTLLFGVFPRVTRLLPESSFSCILALDVFEHSPEPDAFLAECARLMERRGQLLLMLPLAGADMPERMYCAEEHVYLHSPENMARMLYAAGFGEVEYGRWCSGHEVVSGRRI